MLVFPSLEGLVSELASPFFRLMHIKIPIAPPIRMTEPIEAHTAIIIVEVEDSSLLVGYVPPLLSMITGSPDVSFLVGP